MTVRSVLLQGYPNLEYIVIDGGSTDGSVDIIRKYEPWLSYWVSEADRGQADALNKGFEAATGTVFAWLNSDDWYLPNVLLERATLIEEYPSRVMVYGDCNFVNEKGELLHTWESQPCTAETLLLEGNRIPQQSTFMRAATLAAIGGISPDLHYIMDYELWVRLGLQGELAYIPGCVANFRLHTNSKSVAEGYRFMLETLAWLNDSEEIREFLSPGQRAEMLRRVHLKTALEYILANEREMAAHHAQIAFEEGEHAYGDMDALAERLANASGVGGSNMHDSWAHFATLKSVLRAALPGTSANRLWRRAAARYHMRQVFQAYRQSPAQVARSALLLGLWYDPRWLSNAGVRSIALEAVLGEGSAAWMKKMFRRTRD